MPSDLASRYKTVRNLVARSKAAGRFNVGDPVRVLPSHGFAHYRGDTGVIDKMIPINKAYVESEKNGRIIVDLDDLEKIEGKAAALDESLKSSAFTFLRESRFPWLAMGMAEEAKRSGEHFGMQDAAKCLKAWFDGRKPEGSKEEAGYRYIQSGAGKLLMNGLIKGVTDALRGTGARVGLKDVGEAIVAFAEGK
jgi:hypothetical protein